MPSTVRIPGYGETPLPDHRPVEPGQPGVGRLGSAPCCGHHRRGRAHTTRRCAGTPAGWRSDDGPSSPAITSVEYSRRRARWWSTRSQPAAPGGDSVTVEPGRRAGDAAREHVSPSSPPAASAGTARMASASDWHAKITTNVDDLTPTASRPRVGRGTARCGTRRARRQAVSRDLPRTEGRGLYTRGAAPPRSSPEARPPGPPATDSGVAWLLVETAPGVKLSWPAAEARPVAMAGVGDFKPGDRVTDQQGQLGTIVGPGAAGDRVVIQWDDGSTSNLSAVDLERWGVARKGPTVHARGATALARIGDIVSCPVCGQQVKVTAVTFPGRATSRAPVVPAPRQPRRSAHRPPLRALRDATTRTPAARPGLLQRARPATASSPRDAGRSQPGAGGHEGDGRGRTTSTRRADRFTQVGVRWDDGSSLMLSIRRTGPKNLRTSMPIPTRVLQGQVVPYRDLTSSTCPSRSASSATGRMAATSSGATRTAPTRRPASTAFVWAAGRSSRTRARGWRCCGSRRARTRSASSPTSSRAAATCRATSRRGTTATTAPRASRMTGRCTSAASRACPGTRSTPTRPRSLSPSSPRRTSSC